jgi:hypothetical protein
VPHVARRRPFWILAGVLGLVSLIVCVTVILLPLGIPIFRLAKARRGRKLARKKRSTSAPGRGEATPIITG